MNAVVNPVQGTPYSSEEQSGTITSEIDAYYDQAVGSPPAGGWSAEQQARMEEINALEGKGDLTVSDQLRLLELKTEFAKEAGVITQSQFDSCSSSITSMKEWLDLAMTTGYTDVELLNNLVGMLEMSGINTANSPLIQKRDALIANPNLPISESLKLHAAHHTQMAESYAEGSEEREEHLSKAAYLNEASVVMEGKDANLGTDIIGDFEEITFSKLDSIDPKMLRAEAALFKGLAEAREQQIRSEGKGEYESVEQRLADDPLLQYYRGREALANDTAAQFVPDAEGNPPRGMDLLNIRMNYMSSIAKMDNVFYGDMADLAKARGDEDSQRYFESKQTEASDREGEFNKIWQTLINIMSQAIIGAAPK